MKVLLIEDDPANVELMRLRLEALDCRVVEARTADDALRLAVATAPDLILLDMRLHLDLHAGAEVLRALRAEPATRSVPVVIHSIFVNEPRDLPEGLPAVEGLLPKPFKFQDLKVLIERFRPPAAPPDGPEAAADGPREGQPRTEAR